MNLSVIHEAASFAAEAHEGQMRKTNNVPYISHPFTAALYTQTFLAEEPNLSEQDKENIIAAILLHDVLEDTSATENQIKELFGKAVTELVIGASEEDKSKTWLERKSATIQKTEGIPLSQRYVICADKIHNLHSMLESKKKLGDKVWDSFKEGKEKQQWYFTSLYEALTYDLPVTPPMFTKMKDYIDEIFK